MSNGQIVTTQGKGIAFHRLWTPSPTQTAPTLFAVGTGTNTPVIGDTDLQTPVTIAGGNAFKTFDVGYPSLDTTNLQATIRCLLLTTDANGNSLTEFGLKNTDGTKKLFSRAVHTPVTKSTSVQVIYIEKDKII